jgi:DNA gyrase subunit A
MGRATSGVTGMATVGDDSVLSMSVIRAAQAAAEDAEESAETHVQYVFTMTDGGYAKRTRINEYRLTNRGTKGVRAMGLTNADRGGLVGAFIVEEGDEILSITAAGQVVRSPINADFRPLGRSAQGVKFVSPKSGDTVAVVARSVEAKVVEEAEDDGAVTTPIEDVEATLERAVEAGVAEPQVSPDVVADDTMAADAPTVDDTDPEGVDPDPGEDEG